MPQTSGGHFAPPADLATGVRHAVPTDVPRREPGLDAGDVGSLGVFNAVAAYAAAYGWPAGLAIGVLLAAYMVGPRMFRDWCDYRLDPRRAGQERSRAAGAPGEARGSSAAERRPVAGTRPRAPSAKATAQALHGREDVAGALVHRTRAELPKRPDGDVPSAKPMREGLRPGRSTSSRPSSGPTRCGTPSAATLLAETPAAR
jgi:hypothetical protein